MRLINFRDPKLDDLSVGVVLKGMVFAIGELLGWDVYAEESSWAEQGQHTGEDVFMESVEVIDEASIIQLPVWLEGLRQVTQAQLHRARAFRLEDVELLPPVYPPTSLRDFYAFEQHVRTARANRGLEVPPEWYSAPAFYFSNARAVVAPGADLACPRHGRWLDFELEIAAVIGMECRDVAAEQADAVIAGYTIMNDWSLRDLQLSEVQVGLGPAKGKDFATSLGPFLVTPDELADCRSGKGFDLTLVARVNGREVSQGSWHDIYWSFGDLIARASQGVTLYPGDVLGSGTVGTGCLLEIGTHHSDGSPIGSGEDGWLGQGDLVELEVERLGLLANRIVPARPVPTWTY